MLDTTNTERGGFEGSESSDNPFQAVDWTYALDAFVIETPGSSASMRELSLAAGADPMEIQFHTNGVAPLNRRPVDDWISPPFPKTWRRWSAPIPPIQYPVDPFPSESRKN